jgi:hypothetical protein
MSLFMDFKVVQGDLFYGDALDLLKEGFLIAFDL